MVNGYTEIDTSMNIDTKFWKYTFIKLQIFLADRAQGYYLSTVGVKVDETS